MVNTFDLAGKMLAMVLVLMLAALAPVSRAQLKTGNQYVTGIVESNTGWITIRIAPGRQTDPILSYPNKSFVSVLIADKIFTNNNIGTNIQNDPRFGGMLDNGVTRKVADTIITTWANKNGCDIIQEIYPVALLASGQIVMRWKVKNNSPTTPVWGQAQFLLDLQVGDQNPNDGAPVLTRYGYRPIWEKYTSGSQFGIPWFYAAFENELPNSPTFETGITGVGYTQDVNYKLGLKKPAQMTIGDWGTLQGVYALVDFLWGVSGSAPWGANYGDAAILFQWDGVGVGGGKTSEIARTSYGTGEFGICTGQLFGIVFYPRLFQWNKTTYEPETANVEFYAFNTYSPMPADKNYGPPSSNTYLKIHTGPNLRIVWPDTATNATKTTQRQQTDPSGYISQYSVGTCSWKIVADKATDCEGQRDSWLKFWAESSLSGTGGIFVNSGDADTCEHHLLIDCVEEDFIAPAADTAGIYTYPFAKTLNVHDDRIKDKGLDKITFAPQPGSGTDLSKFQIDLPVYPPCSKDKQLIRVTQQDSTVGGCIDFTLVDCAGNDTIITVCLEPHPKNPLIDTLPPLFTTVEHTPGYPGSDSCNGRCDSILVTDNRQYDNQYDVGLKSIEVVAIDNMNVSALNVPWGAKLHPVMVCVADTMKDGFVTLRAKDTLSGTDSLRHSTDTTYRYCTIADTLPPDVRIDSNPIKRGEWTVIVSEIKPWDRLIDSIIVTNMVNVAITNGDPSYPNAKNREQYSFVVSLIDTSKDGRFCVYATDQAVPLNRSIWSCVTIVADSDKLCPNFTITPPLTPALTRIDVVVDDYHVTSQGDTLGWDKGIDSIWFTNVRGILVPSPMNLGCVKVSPSFTLSVEDTLNVDSLACATINALDCAGNLCQYQWCYPYNPDELPPLLRVRYTDRSTLIGDIADSQLYDRGVRIVTLKNEVNFSPLNLSVNRDPVFTMPPITRPKYSSSSSGTLEAVDYWGTLNVTPAERDAHTASIDVSVWVQDLQMKRGEIVREPGAFELPIRFVANDTFSLVRKGIDEIEFTFTLSGDVSSVNFLGVRTGANATHLATAADGWTFDPVVPSGNTYRIHGTKPASGSSLFQVNGDTLLALQFDAVKNDFTKDVLLTINQVGGETVIYNKGVDRIATGKNAIATLPAPYGTLSGSNIVIVGACAPSLQTGSQPPTIVSLEQNTPNPTTGMTNFTFSVKEDGMVKLSIYDMLGQEIESLVNMVLERGRYTVTFNGSKLSAGNYVARLAASGTVRSRMLRIQR